MHYRCPTSPGGQIFQRLSVHWTHSAIVKRVRPMNNAQDQALLGTTISSDVYVTKPIGYL